MRKTGYLLFVLALFIIVTVPGISFAWECTGPDGARCLGCHHRTDLHAGPHGTLDCLTCHCGDDTSPCDPDFGPVDTFCCTTCHNGCVEINENTLNYGVDCLT